MFRALLLLLLITSCFVLICDSPYNAFEEPGNAKGSIKISSESGVQTDSAFVDSTGSTISIEITLFLLKYIESVITTIIYDDGTIDTLFGSLFEDGATDDNRADRISLKFLRGGRALVRLEVDRINGTTFIDSAVLYLRHRLVRLSSFSIDGVTLKPAFNSTVYDFSATIPYERSTLSLRPVLTNPYGILTINDEALGTDTLPIILEIDTGITTFTIRTFTEDSTMSVPYTLTITRRSIRGTDVSLSRIILSKGMLTPGFDPDTLRYIVLLPYNDSVVTIDPQTADSMAIVRINEEEVPTEVTLGTGTDSVEITVTSMDSLSKRTYLLIFNRSLSNSAALIRLNPSAGTLFPSFNSEITNYALLVPDTVESIVFNAVPLEEDATITINNGDPDSAFSLLSIESTPFSIVVTAPDGITKQTYSITVARGGSDVALLSAIELSVGALIPHFHFDTLTYELRIPYDTTGVSIKPQAAHSRAKITVNGSSVESGGWSHRILCDEGKATSIEVVVESESGERQSSYRIAVNRAWPLTVVSNGNGSVTPNGTVSAFSDVPLAVKAAPLTGYRFDGWSIEDGEAAIDAPDSPQTTVQVESKAEIHASFSLKRYALTITAHGSGDITESTTVGHGEPISVTATPLDGNYFFEWRVTSGSAEIAHADSAVTVVTLLEGDATIEAIFTKETYYLTVEADSNGSAEPSRTVAHGVANAIYATAHNGYHFSGWEVTSGVAGIDDPNDDTTSVTLTEGDATVTATFALNRYRLTLTANGNGDVDGPENDTVSHGVAATITATPGTGMIFYRWEVTGGSAEIDDSSKASTAITVTKGDAAVTAFFTSDMYELTVSAGNNGSVADSGLRTIAHGVASSVKATPENGYHFVKWTVSEGSGVIISDSTADSTTVTLTGGNATLTATFAINRYRLLTGSSGNGTVEPTPSVTVDHGTPTDIIALPTTGYHFTGWRVLNGTAVFNDSSAPATTVTLSQGDAEIEGGFAIDRYLLSVSSNGNGTVTPTNDTLVIYESAVPITATSATGYHFTAWSVTNGQAEFTDDHDAATTVTLKKGDAAISANFEINRYKLTLQSDGNGSVNPPTDSVDYNVPRDITATPTTGYYFSGWNVISGSPAIADTDDSSTTVTLTDGDAVVEATFAINVYRLTIATSGPGTATASRQVNHNEQVTITATPDNPGACQPFKMWLRSSTYATITDSTASGTTIRCTGDVTVTAQFITAFDTIYVDSAAAGENSGASWPQAFTDLQDALGCAQTGMVVLVAKGTYYPSGNDRNVSFVVPNGVKIFGGYQNGGGSHNIETYITNLSGNILHDGDSTNNSRVIVRSSNADSSTRIDGVTIREAFGEGTAGGALEMNNSVMKIKHCTFRNNVAVNQSNTFGGGITITDGGPITISACNFIENYSEDNGGAVLITNCNVTMDSCTFSGNSARIGGALFSLDSLTVSNCFFTGNICSTLGGAVRAGALVIENSTFSNNKSTVITTAVQAGGAVFSNDDVRISNSYFSRNHIIGTSNICIGGAVTTLHSNKTLTLTNCTFSSNYVSSEGTAYGGAVHCTDAQILNCTFTENYVMSQSPIGGAVGQSLDAALQVVNSTFTQNRLYGTGSSDGTGTSVYSYASYSSTKVKEIVNSIFWNDNTIATQHVSEIKPESVAVVQNCIIQDGYTGTETIDSIFTDNPLLGGIDSTSGPVPFIPISSSSPARDMGTTNVPTGIDISTDVRGSSRNDGNPDIGAYEY